MSFPFKVRRRLPCGEKEFFGSAARPRQLCESRYKSTAGHAVSELKKKKHLKKMMIMTIMRGVPILAGTPQKGCGLEFSPGRAEFLLPSRMLADLHQKTCYRSFSE